ncbi:MAG: Hsp20/alpha crystallin family protein [Planctomycetota bacterium]|jgi:HSP20 family protein
MEKVSQALNEVRGLFKEVAGRPAPEIAPHAFTPFPPGADPVSYAISEVKHLKQLAEQALLAPVAPTWVPRADMFATDEALVIRVEIPGVTREDIKVTVVGGECIVRGERKHAESAVERPLQLEHPWGPFERHFLLPAGCRANKLAARYEQGILEIRVPLDPTRMPEEKAIEVV